MSRAPLAAALLVAACGAAPRPHPAIIPLDAGTFAHRYVPDAGEGIDSGASYGSVAGQVVLFGASSSAGVRVSLAPEGLTTTSSDDQGDFLLTPVPPGPFTLTFSSPGYANATLSDVLAPGDAAFESVLLQRSVVLVLLDGGPGPSGDAGAVGGASPWAVRWIAGATSSDGGTPIMHAATANTLFAVDTSTGRATPLYVDPVGLLPVGASPGGVAFLFAGVRGEAISDAGEPAILVAADGVAHLVSAPGLIVSSAVIAGDRLFFARPQDAGGQPPWLMSWSSVGAGEEAPVPELDGILIGPAPVVFGQGLAGYRQQTLSCYQLVAFGGGSFKTLADCLPFWPTELDSSLDGQLVTAITSADGSLSDALFEILALDGGASTLDSEGLVAGTHAIPLTPDELYWENDLGQMMVITTSATVLYLTLPIAHVVRPGGSFLAEAQSDGGVPTVLVTDNGNTTLPFGEPWSTPLFSPDGRYVLFAGVPTLFDLVQAAQYPLLVNPASMSFSARSDKVVLIGEDGTLVLLDLSSLPAPGAGGLVAQPAGTLLEGTEIIAAALTPDGAGVVYGGTDPSGRSGIFFEPAP